MIDITNDDTLTLAEACRLLPRGRNNAKPHLSTLLRWITDGATAPDGRRIRRLFLPAHHKKCRGKNRA